MSNKNDKYILGLDLGIASLGWAITKYNSENNEYEINDFGVRLWNPSEEAKSLESKTFSRRNYRSARRLQRRRLQRINDFKNLFFFKNSYLTSEQIDLHFEKLTKKDNNYSSENDELNPLKLRFKGLTEELTVMQLFIALYNIVKRRGYSNLFDIENEDREIIDKSRELIKEYGTPIESIIKSDLLSKGYRNKNDQKVLFLREHYKKEVEILLNTQVKFGTISQEFMNDILSEEKGIFRQRYFEDSTGPKDNSRFEYNKEYAKKHNQNYYPSYHDSIGNCTFYKDQKRITNNSLFADLFVILNETSKFATKLSLEKRRGLFEEVIKKYLLDLSFSRKIISEYFDEIDEVVPKLEQGVSFEKSKLFLIRINKFNPEWVKKELKEINGNWENIYGSKLEAIGRIMGNYSTPGKIIEEIKNSNLKDLMLNTDQETFSKIKKINSSGRKNVSQKLIEELIESSVEDGKDVHKFLEEKLNLENENYVDLRIEQIGNVKTVKDALKNVFKANIKDSDMMRNAVIYRSINQTRLVISSLLKIYNNFDVINVEVARDLYASKEERRSINNVNKNNQNENQKIIKILEGKGFDPSKVNIEKYKLWEQQKFKKSDPFAIDFYDIDLKKEIKLEQVINEQYEIDHIIPYSNKNDNTLWNKVITSRENNQNKGQMTPIEWFRFKGKSNGISDKQIDKQIKSWESKIRKNFYLFSNLKKDSIKSKLENLFSEKYNRYSNEDGFETKDLNDIRYISKYINNYLNREFKIYSSILNLKMPKINNIRGSVTSHFRREWLFFDEFTGEINPWGIENKVREITPYHHCVDAIILSQFENFTQIEYMSFFVKLKNSFRYLTEKFKNKEITINDALKDFEETYKGFVKFQNFKKNDVDENNNEKKLNYINPKQIYNLKLLFELLYDALENNLKINDKKLKSYNEPLVKNLSHKIINLIPIKLKVEKVEVEYKYIDKESNEEIIYKKNEKKAKFVSEVSPLEWSKINNIEINKFPFPSYKIEKRVRGSFIGSENPISKKDAYIDNENNLKEGYFIVIDDKCDDDKCNNCKYTIWSSASYYGLNLETGKFIRNIELNKLKNKSSNGLKILSVNMPFIFINGNNIEYKIYQGVTGNNIVGRSLFLNKSSIAKYKEKYEYWPLINISKYNNFKKINISILGKSQKI